jgi:hypothetical protein
MKRLAPVVSLRSSRDAAGPSRYERDGIGPNPGPLMTDDDATERRRAAGGARARRARAGATGERRI